MGYRIREARDEDISPIRDFYARNPDPHVMPRPKEVLQRAIENGRLFLLEDVLREPIMIGVSGVYVGYYDGMRVAEAGGSLIATNYRGHGLHKICHYVRSVTVYHQEDTIEGYFGGIICPNPESVGSITSVGFKEWRSPPPSLVAERLPFAQEGQTIVYFSLHESTIFDHAFHILSMFEEGGFNRRGAWIDLYFDIRLTDIHLPTLRYLASKSKFAVGRPGAIER